MELHSKGGGNSNNKLLDYRKTQYACGKTTNTEHGAEGLERGG
jgi:hypothetical protein